MRFIKKNYGWIMVTILAMLPLFIILKMININFINSLSNPQIQSESSDTINMLYHITGEFSIRWMTAVLTCTPFFILFGVNNLYVRQAMGIATAVWSILHFIFFLLAEGLATTFTQANYIAGFIAVLLLLPLLLTSNRKSMKKLKANWKKLQSLSYVIVFLSLLHIALLDKTWLIYAIVVGIGFLIRVPFIKNKIISIRTRKISN